ncbi:hypothetical protein ACHAXM_010763, partial [Skeletonema potamos]
MKMPICLGDVSIPTSADPLFVFLLGNAACKYCLATTLFTPSAPMSKSTSSVDPSSNLSNRLPHEILTLLSTSF